jgi:hypothetical protein
MGNSKFFFKAHHQGAGYLYKMTANISDVLHVEEWLENSRPEKCIVDEILHSNM